MAPPLQAFLGLYKHRIYLLQSPPLSPPPPPPLLLSFFFFFSLEFRALCFDFALMGFFAEDSGVILTQAALMLAVLRWVLTWLLRLRNRDDNDKPQDHRPFVSSQTIRESLTSSTYGDIKVGAPLISDTCAVCLAQLSEPEEVRELRNCCHVFHKECIDRWLDYDQDHDDHENHKTCPLCRAPLLTSSQSVGWARSEPSWAVERILYLFGDDLL